VKILDQVKVPFAFGIRLGNLLGLSGLERHHHPLDPVHPRTGHVDHVLIETRLGLVELEHLENLGMRLFLGLSFGKEGGFLGNGIFQDESREFGQGFHSAKTLSQFRRKVKPTRC
jgi:hypothetical protein